MLSGLVLAGVVLTPLAGLTATPAGAQETVAATSGTSGLAAPAGPSAVAARLVAARRAAEHRRQADLAREQVLASLAQLAAQAQTARIAPVLDAAVAKLGRPYVRGAAGPNAFDCSGFTRWAWQAAGVELPHYSGAQWAQTDHISVDDLQPGDLVFFYSPVSHVGIYAGNGMVLNATQSGEPVQLSKLANLPFHNATRLTK